MDRLVMQPGQGWMSRDAAKVAYGLTDKELEQVFRALRPSGGSRPRNRLAIRGLEQRGRSVRGELGQ